MKVQINLVDSMSAMHSFLAVPTVVYGKTVPPSAGSFLTSMRFMPLGNPLLKKLRYANFVAMEGNRPVGRITASVDSLNPRPEEGFWGCFECLDRTEVAEALLESAAGWLKKQGQKVMIGPATLNTNQQVGLLIKGFEYEPLREIPYNPAYYQGLVEGAGLEKCHDLESFKWELPQVLPRSFEKVPDLPGLVVRPVNYGGPDEAAIMREINNKALSEIWGFIPISLDEARDSLAGLAMTVPPGLFLIAEIAKTPAAMLLTIPYKQPRRDGTGGLCRLAVGGIVPEFRGKGLHKPVLLEMFRQCKRLGYIGGEASQIAISNDGVKDKVIKPLFGGEIIKIHRVYKRDI